jgi:hypothetical protein
MQLKLNRIFKTNTFTIGELYINEKYVTDTLEDRVRPEGEKVYGKTAIPEGTYEVKLTHSPRFKKILPEILNVPNFSGIRIHSLNKAEESEGCIGVGEWNGKDTNWISNSRKTFNKLFALLEEANNNKEKITITINNSWKAVKN